MLLRTVSILAILLSPALSSAQEITRLSGDDVMFQFAGVAEDPAHMGSKISTATKASSKRVCGFQIRGNHISGSKSHIEWDMNIDQIVTPERSIAGVSAGTFAVVDHKRTPRSPITDLSFTLEGAPAPIVAEVQGTPNADNGIVALLEAGPANRLFSEFQTMHPIIIALKYSDGTSERLEVRGFRDSRKFGGGKNSYFEECLRGFRVTTPGEVATRVR